MSQQNLVKDPVCQMQVEKGAYAIEYQGLQFSFCSQQCRERFTENPGLYIGRAGQPSPVQQGAHRHKHRKIRLESAPGQDKRASLANRLRGLMGVMQIAFKDDVVELEYDLFQVTSERIEQAISEEGLRLAGGWFEHLRRFLVHIVEDLEVSAAGEASGGHHHH